MERLYVNNGAITGGNSVSVCLLFLEYAQDWYLSDECHSRIEMYMFKVQTQTSSLADTGIERGRETPPQNLVSPPKELPLT